jgi:hypothetical protein
LDTEPVSGGTAQAVSRAGTVNGPEGEALDWPSIDWRAAERTVRRLRQRIFTASRAGDLKKVRSLQELMLRSQADALLSVRRVTELNAGRATAGVDGVVVLSDQARADLAGWVQRATRAWTALPVRRVFIRRLTGSGVHLGYRRRRHTAASSSDELGSVVVTHPFHPLSGQRLEVLYAKARGAERVLVCSGGVSGLITLPVSWTDRGVQSAPQRLSVEGLAALAAATRGISSR